MFYKLEYIKSEDMFNVIDVVEKKVNDQYIYATQEELERLKPSVVINYMSLLNKEDN